MSNNNISFNQHVLLNMNSCQTLTVKRLAVMWCSCQGVALWGLNSALSGGCRNHFREISISCSFVQQRSYPLSYGSEELDRYEYIRSPLWQQLQGSSVLGESSSYWFLVLFGSSNVKWFYLCITWIRVFDNVLRGKMCKSALEGF